MAKDLLSVGCTAFLALPDIALVGEFLKNCFAIILSKFTIDIMTT